MKKRIVFEDPAPLSIPKKKSTIRDFIEEHSKHPDRRAVITRTTKTQSYYYKLQQSYPNLKVAGRQNPGRSTFTVYFMWTNDEAASQRIVKRDERIARRQSKRTEVMGSAPVMSVPTTLIALPSPVSPE